MLQNLSTLLQVHRLCEATDSRDKIFAFLGIANQKRGYFSDPEKASFLMPDYGVSVAQLYTAVTKLFIMENKGLQAILNRGSNVLVKSPLSEVLPSWVPDYTAPVIPHPLKAGGNWNWLACGEHMWIPDSRRMDDPLLGVQGIFVGEVCQRSVPYAGPEAGDTIHERWSTMIPLLREIGQFYMPIPNP
jgi:hypothetical protein